jgi:urease accessory protein
MVAAASGFLAALQLGDSSLPIGRFSHSLGLEALLGDDASLTEAQFAELLEAAIGEGIGPLDGTAVAHAHRATRLRSLDSLLRVDRAVTVRKLTPGARLASQACGHQLTALLPALARDEFLDRYRERVSDGSADGNLAVIEGALACSLGITCRQAVLLELRGSAVTMISAAVRLGRLSALRGQAILRDCRPAIEAAASEAMRLPLDAMRSTLPELEIHAARHRLADARMFMT